MFRVKHCREIILKILYQADLLHIPAAEATGLIDSYFQSFPRVTDEEQQYISTMIELVVKHQEEFDRRITRNLVGWKLSRLSPIERSLLRMGMAESLMNTVQKAIIIDDVIRMSKKYGDLDSYKFINAILDKVIQ